MVKLRSRWAYLVATLMIPVMGWGAPLDPANVEARWVPSAASIQPGTSIRLGLRLDHAPHWHTYWQNPGDFGYATTVEWDLPDGFRAEELEYATPMWIPSQGLVSFGYEGQVTHLVTLHVPAEATVGSTVRIGGEVSWLECRESCIPGGGPLYLDLPVTDVPEPATSALDQAEARLPWTPEAWSALTRIEGEELLVNIAVPEAARQPTEGMRFFPNTEGLVDLATEIAITTTEEGYQIRARLNPSREGTPEIPGGLLVAAQPWAGSPNRTAAVIQAPFSAETPPAAASPTGMGIPYAILAAFLGGIILNLMPCVFPVISLKILGFVNLAGEDHAKVWRHGLMFAAGVVVSFWAVAGILLAVRASVPSAGWGFQLKEPVVVISMCLLFYLLALNLFGVFEIGTSLTGVGAGAQSQAGMWGTFLSGVLATVVATPCTGPFMGAAIGVALTQPAIVSMAIFTALGVGMATPYLLLSRFPTWLNVIPRPGPWMESLKQFLGFLLMAFALWLVWILNGLRPEDGLSRLLSGLLLVGMAAWIYGRWGGLGRSRGVRAATGVVALACLLGGAGVALSRAPASPWQEYSPELVAKLRASGKPVFVDFTADWCMTCQANKRIALNTARVQAAFRAHEVALVEADWTRQEETITRALAEHQRSGVPLYLLYGPDGGEATVLPQLLTKDIVIDALEDL